MFLSPRSRILVGKEGNPSWLLDTGYSERRGNPLRLPAVLNHRRKKEGKQPTMQRLHVLPRRRGILIGATVAALLLVTTIYVCPIGASSSASQIRSTTFQPKTLQQMIHTHELASTVQVLASQAPSVIIQFPLFPSGVKPLFPNATGVVTIVEGNPAISLFDTVTVDVANMP